MSINRAPWIRPAVKGGAALRYGVPLTDGLIQGSVNLSAGGGEEYFQDEVRFSSRMNDQEGHRLGVEVG